LPGELCADLFAALQGRFSGELRAGPVERLLYSSDASIYQVEPLGAALPRRQEDLQALVQACARFGVPVIARGAGSGLAGQAIGAGLVVDCSRYLNRLEALDHEAGVATAEPGLVLAALNRAAAKHALQFGPDPASAERATLGGSLANNASGAHSITYGMAADHLLSAEVILADGTQARLEEVALEEAQRLAEQAGLLGSLDRAALDIRQRQAQAIREQWPRTWRRASGYNLNYLLPWSASRPPNFDGPVYPPLRAGALNLAQLLAGSEGTLALIRQATVRLSRPAGAAGF
jgi:FAD/FMN-containing dehydrogenase